MVKAIFIITSSTYEKNATLLQPPQQRVISALSYFMLPVTATLWSASASGSCVPFLL